jgi:hypothetical protein
MPHVDYGETAQTSVSSGLNAGNELRPVLGEEPAAAR